MAKLNLLFNKLTTGAVKASFDQLQDLAEKTLEVEVVPFVTGNSSGGGLTYISHSLGKVPTTAYFVNHSDSNPPYFGTGEKAVWSDRQIVVKAPTASQVFTAFIVFSEP